VSLAWLKAKLIAFKRQVEDDTGSCGGGIEVTGPRSRPKIDIGVIRDHVAPGHPKRAGKSGGQLHDASSSLGRALHALETFVARIKTFRQASDCPAIEVRGTVWWRADSTLSLSRWVATVALGCRIGKITLQMRRAVSL
jgi:hypothetical protein